MYITLYSHNLISSLENISTFFSRRPESSRPLMLNVSLNFSWTTASLWVVEVTCCLLNINSVQHQHGWRSNTIIDTFTLLNLHALNKQQKLFLCIQRLIGLLLSGSSTLSSIHLLKSHCRDYSRMSGSSWRGQWCQASGEIWGGGGQCHHHVWLLETLVRKETGSLVEVCRG